MRDAEALSKEIDGFTLETHSENGKDISALRAHIREKWTVREILHFRSFTHGGTLSPPGGGWRVNFAGYVAATPDGMRNLVRLFDSLCAEAWGYLGAHLHAAMTPRIHNAELLRNADDLMGATLNALMRTLPANFAEMMANLARRTDEIARRTDEIAADVGAVREGKYEALKRAHDRAKKSGQTPRQADPDSKQILDDAAKMLKDHKKKGLYASKNAIYNTVSARYPKADGSPKMSPGAIKQALRRRRKTRRRKTK